MQQLKNTANPGMSSESRKVPCWTPGPRSAGPAKHPGARSQEMGTKIPGNGRQLPGVGPGSALFQDSIRGPDDKSTALAMSGLD